MDGIKSKTTQINSNRISVNDKILENSIEYFWKIDSYSTTKDINPSLLPRNLKKALDILKNIAKEIMVIILWDYYGQTNFLIYQITEV